MSTYALIWVITKEPLSEKQQAAVRERLWAEGCDVYKKSEKHASDAFAPVRDEEAPANTYEVGTLMRYYGRSYRRGPLRDIIKVAEVLESQLPGCVVRYGPDDSGAPEPWPAEARAALLEVSGDFDLNDESPHP